MTLEKLGHQALLGALYDGGVYAPLFETQGEVLCAYGAVGGQGAYAVCQKGGPLAEADLSAARRTLRLAAKTGNPVVTFYNSPGVRLENGLKNLEAVRRLGAAAAKLSGVAPQIAVITGVCGASAALSAAAADVCIMTKDAELFLTPPFLSAAAGDKTPGAGGAESAVRAGIVGIVAESGADAAAKAARVLELLPQNNLAETAAFEFSAPQLPFPEKDYGGIAAVRALCDAGSELELFAGFGAGLVTALCTVAGNAAGIVAANGPGTEIGALCATRAARFVRLCDAYSIPVVTVLNTGGFTQSSKSDEDGMIRFAGRLAAAYGDATTAKVAILAGRTFGPVYTALAGADLTIALRGSVTAPVQPSAAVSVLYKEEIAAAGAPIEAETARRAKLYEAEEAGAEVLYKAGLANFVASGGEARGCLVAALDILATKRAQRLPKKHGNMAL